MRNFGFLVTIDFFLFLPVTIIILLQNQTAIVCEKTTEKSTVKPPHNSIAWNQLIFSVLKELWTD